MDKRKRSLIWNYFTPEENGSTAICKLCRNTLQYRSSISNLKKHLLRKHPHYDSSENFNVSNVKQQTNDTEIQEHSVEGSFNLIID